jgi:hypothetical protein
MVLMKKISALFASACIIATCVASNASADTKPAGPAVSPVAANLNVAAFVNWTWVKGTIKVPANLITGNVAGLTCADLGVSAVSQAQNPAPPGGFFASPKWTHHVHATGNLASGTCSYALTVPPNSSFAVSAGSTAPGTTAVKCYLVDAGYAPAQAGWFKLAVGTTKEQDFTLTSINCTLNPPA